jgi:hypothetical protein
MGHAKVKHPWLLIGMLRRRVNGKPSVPVPVTMITLGAEYAPFGRFSQGQGRRQA